MENTPPERGLTMTLTWGGGAYRVRRSLSLGSVVRVAAALALCAACYEAGRWHGNLEAQAARTAQRPSSAALAAKGLAVVEPASVAAAPGKAVDDPEKDVITPLNVRDPSALVMAPFATEQAAARPAGPAPEDEGDHEAPPSPPARIFPRPDAKVKPPRKF
ncbi:MAG TPA: hypothetical protein VN915_08885 [Elusimicrobiota bacterium]|nr:hypothetical protein [Elusimicrobiota bacterium]